jgi:serine/threonine-protein kinase
LKRILASDVFVRSERMKRFLNFTVEQTLLGKTDSLKEYSIALAAFDKLESFDPRVDPIVRVEAGRLRSKLREYYESEGRGDDLVITFRKRSYVPTFSFREPAAAEDPRNKSRAARVKVSAEATPPPVPSTFEFDSVAVLPFADLSAKQNQEYFCDGMTEEIVNALGRIPGLQVAARTSAMQFRDRGLDVREIGDRLGVAAVIEGGVRISGKRVRVTAQLINVADGYHLWSDVYDRKMEDIFDLQLEISQAIVRALKVRIADESPGIGARFGTSSSDAYRLYLQARHHWQKGNPSSIQNAVKYYSRACEVDPEYSLARAGLAETYISLALQGQSPEAFWSLAEEAAETAVGKEPAPARAYSALGCIQGANRWDWEGSAKSFLRSVELDPGLATAHHWYGLYCLAPQGLLDRAEDELRKAAELEPVSAAIAASLGWILYMRGELETALVRLEKSSELEVGFYRAHWYAGMIYQRREQYREALAAYQEARRLAPRASRVLGSLGCCHAEMGNKRDAMACLESLRRRKSYVSPVDLACIYLGLGDVDSVFASLERAAEMRCSSLIHVHVDPAFEQLRPDPRFQEILRALRLAK